MLLETPGTFLGTITDASLGTTKKGFPQAILKLTTEKFYAESSQDLQHYGIGEPAYVDFPSTDITGFLVLFNSTEDLSKDTAMFHYEDLKRAVGWDGTSFDSLTDGSLKGRRIMFRCEPNTWDGKTSLQVRSVGNKDDSPSRELKKADPSVIKNLNSKLKAKAAPKPVAVAAKAPVVAPKPMPKPTLTAKAVTDITMDAAWEALCEKETDQQRAAAIFEEACQTVAPGKDQDSITKAGQWYKVREIALAKLSA